jgi:hypothetical protein
VADRPSGLPPVKKPSSTDPDRPGLDRSRFCSDCGNEGRVVSNSNGVNVYCGPCKKHWPVSSRPFGGGDAASVPRGLSKHTWIEPEWDKATE